jgi:hypothetical protein
MLDGIISFWTEFFVLDREMFANRYARGARDRSIISGRVVLPHPRRHTPPAARPERRNYQLPCHTGICAPAHTVRPPGDYP